MAINIEFIQVFAVFAGLSTALSPCSYILLPGLIAYLIGQQRVKVGPLLPALATSTGLLVVYMMLGASFGLLGSALLHYAASWLPYISAVIVISLGVLTISNYHIPTVGLRSMRPFMYIGGLKAFLLFGIGYGMAAQACTFPIFLSIVTVAVAAGSVASSIIILLLYGLGVTVPVFLTILLTYVGKGAVLRRLGKHTQKLHKISGGLLIAIGIYILLVSLKIVYIYGTDVIIRLP